MRAGRVLLITAPVLILALLAATASAQNETTTNTTNITVTLPQMPNLTVPRGAEASVSAERPSPTQLKVFYTCFYVSDPLSCPNTTYVVVVANTTVYNSSYAVNPATDCTNTVCRYTLTIDLPQSAANETARLTYVLYVHGEKVAEHTLSLPPPPTEQLAYIVNLIPAVVMAGLALHYNMFLAGVGALASAVVVYLLSLAGIGQANPFVLNIVIIMGLTMIYMSKR